MKAVVYHKYGSPDVLELQEMNKPVVPDDGVLVRVRAASVNPMDWYFLTGTPYFVRMLTGLLKPSAKFWALTSRERLNRSATASSNSNRAMRSSAGEAGR